MRLPVTLVLLVCLAAAGARAGTPVSLALHAATHRDYYPSDSTHGVYLQIHVAAPVQPAPVAGVGAPRRNLAFVLDRSGSMAGERLQAVRGAILASVDLLAPEDLVSVVCFDSEVETVIEATPRRAIVGLEAVLGRLEAKGGAALYDALNQGAAQLRRHAGPAVSSHLVLVTDGPASKGPRETADFVRLAAALAAEGITLSTFGLGEEFNEDQLADLARAGKGDFRYVPAPGGLAAALQEELAMPGALVARDIVLQVEILSGFETLESYGWLHGEVERRTVTYRLPYLFAGQDASVLLGAEMDPRRFSYRFARIRLDWTEVPGGDRRTQETEVTVRLEQDSEVLRRSANVAVIRSAVGMVISEGLQGAIEEMDKGDLRRALRALRRARTEAYDLNYTADDPGARSAIAQLDAYLAEVQARGLNELDRKILRSGLNSRFQIPVAEEEDKP